MHMLSAAAAKAVVIITEQGAAGKGFQVGMGMTWFVSQYLT